ncbi:MAG: RusA family crossover junction endodeoxyribonuclease [Desulfurellales bacterium]|nr:MAG: RusA family crossover junction endodeoxyribonuclease [Desulfurellales bacterium]
MVATYRTFVIPLPPTDNHLYFNLPNGGRAPTSKFKDYMKEIEVILSTVGLPKLAQGTKLKTTWKAHFICYLEKKNVWKSDLSNRFKIVFDKIAKTIGIDDRYVTFYQASKEKLENCPVKPDIKKTQLNADIQSKEHIYVRLIIEDPC